MTGALRERGLRRWASPNFLLLFPAVATLLVIFVYPIAGLMKQSFMTQDNQPTLENYRRLFETRLYVDVLLNTLMIAVYATLLTLLIAYPLTIYIARARPGLRRWLILAVLAPFWTSTLIHAFAWILLLGRRGILNQWLMQSGAISRPLDLIYNFAGVLIGMSHAMTPLAVLTMLPVMLRIDKNLSSAASTLGASPVRSFWLVYFPLSLPGLTAAGLLVFVTALGFFITPALLGSPREMMIVQIIIEQIELVLDWGFASAISLLLVVTTFALIWLMNRVGGVSFLPGGENRRTAGHGSLFVTVLNAVGSFFDAIGTVTGKVGWLKYLLARAALPAVAFAGAGFLVLPAAALVLMSFSDDSLFAWPPKGFTFRWYIQFFDSLTWMSAALRSLGVALVAAILALLIGIPAAYALTKRKVRFADHVFLFLISPLVLPTITIAISIYYFYAKIGLLGNSLGLALAHTVLALPFVVIAVSAILKGYDTRMDQAARTLGASPAVAFRRITMPLIMGGILSAFLFAFVKSFEDLTIALFLTGGLQTTLPKQMWIEALLLISPMLAAVSTLVMVFVVSILLTVEFTNRKFKMDRGE